MEKMMETITIRGGATTRTSGERGIFAAGAIAAIATCALVAAAVGLYFIWPYSPDRLSAAEILVFLARDPFGALVSLDVLMLAIAPVNMLVFISLFAALYRTNTALAVTALACGVLAFACLVVCRPVAELFALSRSYASAISDSEKKGIAFVAEGLLAYFKGTGWFIQTVLYPIAGIIFAILMRRSPAFSKADSAVGVIISALAFGFFIPKLGMLLLFANTIGSIPWYIMVGRRLAIMSKNIDKRLPRA